MFRDVGASVTLAATLGAERAHSPRGPEQHHVAALLEVGPWETSFLGYVD